MLEVIVKNNHPDYAAMKILISGVQKLIIKDVVQYADRRMTAYRQVTENRAMAANRTRYAVISATERYPVTSRMLGVGYRF